MTRAREPGARADGVGRPGRRRVLALAAGAAAGLALPPSQAQAKARRFEVVCFDAFSIFDPRPVLAAAGQVSPQLGAVWFQKVFADTWLRTAAQRYIPFPDVVAEALDYCAATSGVVLSADVRGRLLEQFWSLDVWPDVGDGLDRLRQAGLRLAFLSNMSEPMLRANMRRNGIEPFFEAALSTDPVRAFKPSPAAYASAARAMRCRRTELLFAPFAAWDAVGAAWYGYPTAWVNRPRQPAEPGAPAVLAGTDIAVVLDAVGVAAPGGA